MTEFKAGAQVMTTDPGYKMTKSLAPHGPWVVVKQTKQGRYLIEHAETEEQRSVAESHLIPIEDYYIGRIGVCSRGHIGLIEGRKELEWGLSWTGVDLLGKPWASRDPQVLRDGDARLLQAAFFGPRVARLRER